MPTKKKQAPGERVIRLCKKSMVVKHLFSHFHLEQLSHDYFLFWHEALTEQEKMEVRKEYERQVVLALVVPLGIHAGEAAILHFVMAGGPVMSIGYFLIATVMWGFMRRLL